MRAVILMALAALLPLTSAVAQSPTVVAPPSVVFTPPDGGPATTYQAHAAGLPALAAVVAVLFSPGGAQQIMPLQTDAAGSADVSLPPPAGGWQVGLYRLAIGYGSGQSVSATFATEDGTPHLFAEPLLPSPTSAFNLVGIGFGADSTVHLVLLLTGGVQGQADLQAPTDATGAFSIYVWPQQLGLTFFAAGIYQVQAPDQSLSINFTVREHPISSYVTTPDAIAPQSIDVVDFAHYTPHRYLWGIYANQSGTTMGEFLIGPTDLAGDLHSLLQFPALPPGDYLLATPYDWGETQFTVPDPTVTPTPTAAPTLTPTLDPTTTPTPKHSVKPKRKCKRRVKRCARRRAPVSTPTPTPGAAR